MLSDWGGATLNLEKSEEISEKVSTFGKQEDIDQKAAEWASILHNKKAREHAEQAARIILEHGFDLPRLSIEKLANKDAGADYRAPLFDGDKPLFDNGKIRFNEKLDKPGAYEKALSKAKGYNAHENAILHELGHMVDALTHPKAYESVEHRHKMSDDERKLIKRELGEYATTNRAEFEAELNSSIMLGKTFSKELMSLSGMHNPEANTAFAKKLIEYGSGKDINLPNEDLRAKFKDMIKAVYHQEGSKFSMKIMASKEVQGFIDRHAELMNGSFVQTKLSDTMRSRLEQSNYVFSGMKTFHELKEAFPSLLDEKGNRKSFEQFLNDVQKIDQTYNKNYLRAEYDFVQGSADMAARWESFDDSDRYCLQYRTAGDSKVRPEHAKLEGVTLPKGDSFWDTYYPPNGWGCRCTVVEVRRSKYPQTPHEEAMERGKDATGKDKKGMFRFNPGKEGRAMPAYNPYTIAKCSTCDKSKLLKLDRPDSELCSACSLLHQCLRNKAKRFDHNRALAEKYSKDKDYSNVKFNEQTGGMMATHNDHNFDKNKGWYEKAVQEVGFNFGHAVILGKEDQTKFGKKSCEGYWDDTLFEIAGAETSTSSNIRNALKHCASKPNVKIAVILFPGKDFNLKEFKIGLAKYNGLSRTNQYKKFNEIICVWNGKIVYKEKPD